MGGGGGGGGRRGKGIFVALFEAFKMSLVGSQLIQVCTCGLSTS